MSRTAKTWAQLREQMAETFADGGGWHDFPVHAGIVFVFRTHAADPRHPDEPAYVESWLCPDNEDKCDERAYTEERHDTPDQAFDAARDTLHAFANAIRAVADRPAS